MTMANGNIKARGGTSPGTTAGSTLADEIAATIARHLPDLPPGAEARIAGIARTAAMAARRPLADGTAPNKTGRPDAERSCMEAEIACGFHRETAEVAVEEALGCTAFRSTTPGVVAVGYASRPKPADWDAVAREIADASGYPVESIRWADWSFADGPDQEAMVVAFDLPCLPDDTRAEWDSLCRPAPVNADGTMHYAVVLRSESSSWYEALVEVEASTRAEAVMMAVAMDRRGTAPWESAGNQDGSTRVASAEIAGGPTG